jgi:hypothetical protein
MSRRLVPLLEKRVVSLEWILIRKKERKIVLEVVVGVDVEVEYDDVLQVQEGVGSHPEGRRGVGAGGFSLGVPETVAGGEKGLVYK